MQMNLPETVSETLCRNDLVMQTDCFSNCLGGWSQTMLDVLPNSLKCLWRRLMAFDSRATALVDIPVVSMPNACSLKTCDICGIVLCDKTR